MKRLAFPAVLLLILCVGVPHTWAGDDGSDGKVAAGLRKVIDDLTARGDHQTEIPVILQVSADQFGVGANPLGLRRPMALGSIRGYAGRMPPAALEAVLRSPVLEYATLDMPLVSASGGRRVADDFDWGTGYSGNDGGEAWAGDWIEGGEQDGSTSGLLRVVRNTDFCASEACLYLGAYNETSGGPWTLTRRADLSGAFSATLHFNFGFQARSNEGILKVQARSGGGSWSTLKTYAVSKLAGQITGLAQSFDISKHVASDTEIRFALSRKDAVDSNSDEVEGYFYIDDVRIDVTQGLDRLGSDDVVESHAGNSGYLAALGLEQEFSPQLGVRNVVGFNGAGVTVAVFDSGMAPHRDLTPFGGAVQIDFTSGVPTRMAEPEDGHGHGTHVSGIIGGRGFQSSGRIAGVAPMAGLLHLKVIGDDGSGLTSNLILAIEWLIANKDAYGVRVANMSLGHGVIESYQTDPLCKAVRKLVDAGVVTVVSAGNLGKTAEHPEIWGGITSPGNEPSVITVGAVNTRATASHLDDIATTYSSRGHTSFDHMFKPDLAAPGNGIPSTAAEGSYLQVNYPSLALEDGYMQLSGSSMAAAYVSGVAALMLEANPALTPNLVKAALVATAVKMPQAHILEQGNGFLNARTAVLLASQLDGASQTVVGPVDPTWTLSSDKGLEEVRAGGAFVYGERVFYTGLASPTAELWGSAHNWAPSSLYDPFWADTIFYPNAVFWSNLVVTDGGLLWTQGDDLLGSGFWNGSGVWAEGLLWSEGIMWSEGFFWTEGVFWMESFDWGDSD